MKFLITGITGFAGPHLAELLIENNHEVFGLVRCSNGRENDIRDVLSDDVYSKINFVYSDLKNYRTLKNIFLNNKFDGVFHLAAQSHPPTSFVDPIGTFEDNVNASITLIQVISEVQPECRLMACSTSEVYGNIASEDEREIKVTSALLPANPYGASKAAVDLYMQERMQNGFIKGFITRAFSHTGPRRGKNFSISSDAYQIAKVCLGLQEPTIGVGNLNTKRVVIDVRDTVRAYYLLMMCGDKANGKIFNVCGDEIHEMGYFTDLLIKLSGKNIQKIVDPRFYRKIDINFQNGDSSELKELTGWEPKIPIEETLKDLLNYWLKKIN
jgi:GDP-mannose 4,6-dehydratase